MAGRPIQILVVEVDPVMRLGLVTCLEPFSDLQVAVATETSSSALRVLMERMSTTVAIDLVLLGISVNFSNQQLSPTDFCRQVKIIHPDLPILLLTTPQNPNLKELQSMGIEGCCLRGSSILDLVEYIRKIAAGTKIWAPEILHQSPLYADTRTTNSAEKSRNPALNRLIQGINSTSVEQIETALFELNDMLTNPQISALDRLVLTGRRRELNAAHWLFRKLLPSSQSPITTPLTLIRSPQSAVKFGEIETSPTAETMPKAVQSILFDRVAEKLQFNLENLTSIPLEIDLLKVEKKRELFYLILHQFEGLLDELRFSQITIAQLPAKQAIIWQDLWVSVTTDFFGRYYQISTTDIQGEIVPTLLQDREVVQTEILAKIPQKSELLNYLLFQMPLAIDNTIYAASTQTAIDRACELLENITIELANATIQPLLNYFGNSDEIKFSFFDRRLLSTREIERFRNNLSWCYRVDRYFGAPKSIFESKYRLFVFTNYGIKCITIYVARPQELAELSGIPLAVTLALETRDALAPRLKSVATLIGNVAVYLMTEIIGRGIGLIGRGAIKGIGNIWQESNRNRQE
jgi:DNA-binding NarL/FixJ family response regulator